MAALRAVLDRHGAGPHLMPDVIAGFEKPERSNESDGVIFVAAGRRIAEEIAARFGTSRKAGIPHANLLHGNVYRIVSSTMAEMGIRDAKYSALTPERYAALRTTFADSNAAFARAVWNTTWDEVFPPAAPETLRSTDLGDTRDPETLRLLQALMVAVRPKVQAALEEVVSKKPRKGPRAQ